MNSVENRRLEFASILASRKDWVNLGEIANLLDCTERILIEDAVYFRKHFKEFTIETSTKGARIIFNQNSGLKSLYQYMLRNSIAFQLLETLFLNEGQSIAELSNRFYISLSSMYRLIRQVNEDLEHYEFSIETNPSRLSGNETNIRNFFYHYFAQAYTFEDWPFTDINKKSLEKFLNFHISFTHLKNDFAYFNKFKIIGAVNLTRYKNNYFIETDHINMNLDEVLALKDLYSDLFMEFERDLDITYNTELVLQLFKNYLQTTFSLSYENLTDRVKTDPQTDEEVDVISSLLDRIASANNLKIPDKEFLVLALRNIAHLDYLEPKPRYTLYNQDKFFVEEIAQEFPKFYESVYQAMSELRTFLNKPDTIEGIIFYMYTLFTYWRTLLQQLREQQDKIKVLVISDRHISHTRMLRDYIYFDFSEKVDIDIYSAIQLNKESLNLNNS